MEHPHSGLHKKVKGIAFSESIQVRDPFTKQMEKKEIKPFMVNQACILLERDMLILNPNDQVIWKQMEDYSVIKKSISGRPIYTSENEHTLDALMLAILAFTIEMPEITRILQEFEVARKVAYAPRLATLDNRIENSQREKQIWDETDPEERNKPYIKRHSTKEKEDKNRAMQAQQWSPRLSSGVKRPKSRKII